MPLFLTHCWHVIWSMHLVMSHGLPIMIAGWHVPSFLHQYPE
jgi:hypothetical protein